VQDFIVVCGKEFDVRTVTPARALNRFTRAFDEFLPGALKGIDKVTLTQQLTLLSNFGVYFHVCMCVCVLIAYTVVQCWCVFHVCMCARVCVCICY
jgi:hypothetical protein